MTNKLYFYPFAIDETPYCIWDWDLPTRNAEFIKMIDPLYFEYLAETHSAVLDGEEKQYAAVSLRMAYSHALESFFSILGAAIQAPGCMPGWLLKYQNRELNSLIRKIHSGGIVYSKLGIPTVTWETLPTVYATIETGDEGQNERLKRSFALLWQRFAEDFLDIQGGLEYNSLKHGFRVRPGGFSLAIGLQDAPDIPAPPERMESLAHSEFGSTYFTTEKLTESDSRNLRIKKQSVNWDPRNYIAALNLISMSISNVLCVLKACHGESGQDLQMKYPVEESYFEEPWLRSSGASMSFNLHPIIVAGDIRPLSKTDILATYRHS